MNEHIVWDQKWRVEFFESRAPDASYSFVTFSDAEQRPCFAIWWENDDMSNVNTILFKIGLKLSKKHETFRPSASWSEPPRRRCATSIFFAHNENGSRGTRWKGGKRSSHSMPRQLCLGLDTLLQERFSYSVCNRFLHVCVFMVQKNQYRVE